VITEIVTAAPATDLTTLDRVREELGIESDEAQNQRLERLIRQATADVLSCARRFFAQERVKEIVAGHGSPVLQLERTPLVQVHSVAFDGSPVTDFTLHHAEAGQLYRRNGWLWTAAMSDAWIEETLLPGVEEQRYVVEYTAGYQLPSYPTSFVPPVVPPALPTQRLPADIEEYVLLLIRGAHASRDRDPTVTSEHIGDWSATYGGAGSGSILADATAKFIARWGRIA
jgi:hypothetical protein